MQIRFSSSPWTMYSVHSWTRLYHWPLLWFNSITEHLSHVLRLQCAFWSQIVPEKHGLRIFPHVLLSSSKRCILLGCSFSFNGKTACLSHVLRLQCTSGAWFVSENVKFYPFKEKKFIANSIFIITLNHVLRSLLNKAVPLTFTLI